MVFYHPNKWKKFVTFKLFTTFSSRFAFFFSIKLFNSFKEKFCLLWLCVADIWTTTTRLWAEDRLPWGAFRVLAGFYTGVFNVVRRHNRTGQVCFLSLAAAARLKFTLPVSLRDFGGETLRDSPLESGESGTERTGGRKEERRKDKRWNKRRTRKTEQRKEDAVKKKMNQWRNWKEGRIIMNTTETKGRRAWSKMESRDETDKEKRQREKSGQGEKEGGRNYIRILLWFSASTRKSV